MRSRYAGPAAALVVPLLLLAVLDAAVGLGAVVCIAGIACAVILAATVWWLERDRRTMRDQEPAEDSAPSERGALRTGIEVAATVVALVLVWAGLVAPDQTTVFQASAFERLPLELIAVIALAVVLPVVPRRVLAVLAGAALAALILVKVLDYGFITAFDRPFDPISDSAYVGIGIETLRDGVGAASANLLLVGSVVLVIALLAVPVLALLRLTNVAAGNRTWALRAVAALAVLWVALRIVGTPVASSSASSLAVEEVGKLHSGLAAHAILAREIPRDRFRATPGNELLTGLRGKNVLLLFVESYGKAAVQGSSYSPGIDAGLDKGTAQLKAGGFSSRTGYLSSSTFGGLSWLAHVTTQSGIRIGTQRGYDQLTKSNRLTLATAFKRAGWRTIADQPVNKRDWPEGRDFYHYDKVYDRRNIGYRGPGFGIAPMPDQYVLQALQRQEVATARPRRPVFAEVDLISSHTPWTRIPRLIPWDQLGDGSIFNRVSVEESTKAKLFGDAARARKAYGLSIQYTMSTIVSYVRRYGDKNLVVILLGDHQAPQVTPRGASHDVPMSIIAKDPKVTDQIAGWGWTDGLHPRPQAPVMPMAAFRDHFLTAFGSTPKH